MTRKITYELGESEIKEAIAFWINANISHKEDEVTPDDILIDFDDSANTCATVDIEKEILD